MFMDVPHARMCECEYEYVSGCACAYIYMCVCVRERESEITCDRDALESQFSPRNFILVSARTHQTCLDESKSRVEVRSLFDSFSFRSKFFTLFGSQSCKTFLS